MQTSFLKKNIKKPTEKSLNQKAQPFSCLLFSPLVPLGLLGLLGTHRQVRMSKLYPWFCRGQS